MQNDIIHTVHSCKQKNTSSKWSVIVRTMSVVIQEFDEPLLPDIGLYSM